MALKRPLQAPRCGIHMLTPCPLRANCINLVTATPLYVRYSRAHSVPITSILSLPHRCAASHRYPVAPLHHCTNIRQAVSDSYAHFAIYLSPLYVRYSRAHSVSITSILSPPHRCLVALLQHCIDVLRVVSYSYAHSAI